MCARHRSSKPVGYMSFDLFCHVVDQLASRTIDQLTLHQLGEPLLHPRIAEMVAYAKGRGLCRVRFATNGTLLTQDLSQHLIEAGLDSITVSMDSSTAPRYCPSLQGDECIAHLDDSIRRLIHLRDRHSLGTPEVHMQIIRMPSTEDLEATFVEKWEGVADRVTVKPMLSWAGHLRVPGKRPQRRLLCANHLYQGVVQWDGDVSFCCIYIDSSGDANGILGNARTASLDEIFFGEMRRTLIESQLRGIHDAAPYCQKCPDWADYTGWLKAKEPPGVGAEV
jgi:hypothetical protein